MIKILFKLLTFIYIIRKTFAECVTGCLSCDTLGNCLVCDASSLYILVASSCIRNNMPYCALSFTLNSCALCIPGYYLEINRKCTLNTRSSLAVRNCYRYSSYTRCQQCNKYYYQTAGGRNCTQVNTVISKCQIYNGANTCSVCADSVINQQNTNCNPPSILDPSCLFYSNNTVCEACQPGYWLNQNMYISNIQNTFQSIFTLRMDYANTFNILTNVQQCSLITQVPNCIAYDPVSNNCTLCAVGFYLNQTTFQCNMNPVQTGSISSVVIPYCFQYNTNFAIINGINQTVTTCYLCYQGFYVSVNGNKCAPHTINVANCAIYSQSTNGVCLLCTSIYYLNIIATSQTTTTLVCSPRQVLKNCQVSDPMSNQCLNCTDSSFIKYFQNQYCSPPILNCQIYNLNSDPLTCNQCATSFYFNTNSNTCVQNNNYDPYCNIYNSNQVCIKCNYGYYYDPINQACTADTNEYVARCNCTTFNQNIKDTCSECPNYSTLMSVNNTCKLPPTNMTGTTLTNILNCTDYYVDYQGNYNCINAQIYVPNSVYCDATLPNCFPNSLNITSGLVVTVSTFLQYCQAYVDSFTGSGQIPCKQCQASAYFLDYLFISDGCVPNAQMPWCSDTNRTTSTGFCVTPGGHCTIMYYNASGNSNTSAYSSNDQISTCTVCPVDPNVVPGCFPVCTKQQTTNCFKKNNVLQGSGYQCNIVSIPSSTPPDSFCPDFGTNILCGIPIVYQVYVNYAVTLSPDSSQCVLENIYFNPIGVCLLIKNFSCLLCIRGYFPVLTTQLPYPNDYIESYYANQIYPNMLNCMMFDNTTGLCTRCDFAASGTRLNNYGVCVTCNTNTIATDPTQALCLNYFNANLIFGSCYKVDPNIIPSPCLQCLTGTYAQIYDFSINYTALISDVDYIYSQFNVSTYIGNKVNALAVSSCVFKSLLFVSNQSFAQQNQYCEWGYSISQINYCLKCVFGFAGQIGVTSAGVFYLQNCQDNGLICNKDIYYTFNLTSVRYYLSCHVCQNTVNIPTLYMYNDYATNAAKTKFLFSNTAGTSATTFQCVLKSNTLPPSCAAQMFINDINLLAKVNQLAYLCLSCLPSYMSLGWTYISDGSYPYFYTSNCAAILNCADSNVTNVCQQCLPNYNLANNGTACAANPVNRTELQYCNVILNTNGAFSCTSCKNGYKYLQIATNAATPLYSCLPYVVANCQYYNIDQCIQSTKKIGVGYNVIIKRTNYNYFINQSSCNSALSSISNCLFYLDNANCYICGPGYTLGNNKTQCYSRNDPFCQTYDDTRMQCSVCVPGYTFLNSICQPSVIPSILIPLCINYSSGYCSQCASGYTPLIVGNGQTSVCMSNSLSSLCEVINTNGIVQNQVISCSRCMKLTDVRTRLAAKTLTLDQYDFMLYSDYQSYISTGNIVYPTQISSQTYLRSAQTLQPRGSSYCQQFGGVSNCVSFDSADLTHTFRCTNCSVANYYLLRSNYNCILRTQILNCIAYDPYSNTCLSFLGTTNATIVYSVKDIVVTQTMIPAFPGWKVNPNSIAGCVSFSDQTTCLTCNSTMWLYNNLCLTVTITISGCNIYMADGVCGACIPGRLLLQNKCLIIYAQNCLGYLTNTKCLRCPINFPILDQSGSCIFPPTLTNCLAYDNPTTCYQCALPLINVGGECAFGTLVPNCVNNFNAKCRQCSPGYMVNYDRSSCIVNPNYDRNCATFADKNICIVCAERFYLANGNCIACQTSSVTCYYCNPGDPTICLVCNPGFFMDRNGVCNIVVGYVPPLISLLNQNNQLLSALGA